MKLCVDPLSFFLSFFYLFIFFVFFLFFLLVFVYSFSLFSLKVHMSLSTVFITFDTKTTPKFMITIINRIFLGETLWFCIVFNHFFFLTVFFSSNSSYHIAFSVFFLFTNFLLSFFFFFNCWQLFANQVQSIKSRNEAESRSNSESFEVFLFDPQ